MVVLGHGPLALEHLDEHRGLVVLVGGESLRLLGGDDGVAADDLRHHSANGLDTLCWHSFSEHTRRGQRGEVRLKFVPSQKNSANNTCRKITGAIKEERSNTSKAMKRFMHASKMELDSIPIAATFGAYEHHKSRGRGRSQHRKPTAM